MLIKLLSLFLPILSKYCILAIFLLLFILTLQLGSEVVDVNPESIFVIIHYFFNIDSSTYS